jgi:hypothetical protein
MVLPVLVAAATLHAYAATPQGAALGAMYSDPKKPAVVKRMNVAGSYATVLTSGGRIEGELVGEAILVKHFAFGWQPLDVLDDRCTLEAQQLGAKLDAALMTGMPAPKDDRPCRGGFKDTGPSEDVESVRRLMPGPLVPYVLVSGDWAKGEWYGAGGGDALYHKRNGTWTLVENGGGAISVYYMKKFGVPQSAWCPLGIFDAPTCSRR